jgi:prolyl-tRNA synthetase
MLDRALTFRDSHIHGVDNYTDLSEIVKNGWALAWWCGDVTCEAKVKDETKATTRCVPLDQSEDAGECIVCGKTARQRVYFARAY